MKLPILQLESVRYQQAQSIGIHDVHLFNTELAMYYRLIFKYGCFRLFCEQRDFVAVFWSIFLVIKAKQD